MASMKKLNNSRREFLKKGTTGSIGAFLGISNLSSLSALPESGILEKELLIHPRYYRWYPDGKKEWLERNTDYATLEWKIPISNVALVLVDVWEKHYLREPEERADEIIDKNLLPLVTYCRKEGITVIHAPSPVVAKLHPNWVKLVDESEIHSKRDRSWPPSSFRNKTGNYQSYKRPAEPREAEKQKIVYPHVFHPKIKPVDNEPVIAWGEELHRYCRQKGIMFLLYAGFNTNACLITRDYGMLQMCNDRGYETILVRDCTTGMESKDSQASLGQTNGAVLFFEMFGQYSITSGEIIDGIRMKS